MVCVITRCFGAHSKGFHRCPLRFHPHVAVPLQHATAHVSSNRHDRGVRRSVRRKLSDGAVPQIVEPESGQARFLRESSPSRPPALHVPRRVKASNVVIDDPLTAERELRDESGKGEVRRLHGAKAFRPLAKPCERRKSHIGERDDPLTCSRLGLANRQRAGEQVHIAPLQPFQLAASRSGIQAEDRSEVTRNSVLSKSI